MEGKMTKIEKIMAICSLLILITAIIVRGVIGVNDSLFYRTPYVVNFSDMCFFSIRLEDD